MKYNNTIAGLIVIGLILLILSLCKIIYGKVDAPELPEHSVERIEEIKRYKDFIGIFCIDGYKWIITAHDIEQAYIINNKGQVVPARCE